MPINFSCSALGSFKRRQKGKLLRIRTRWVPHTCRRRVELARILQAPRAAAALDPAGLAGASGGSASTFGSRAPRLSPADPVVNHGVSFSSPLLPSSLAVFITFVFLVIVRTSASFPVQFRQRLRNSRTSNPNLLYHVPGADPVYSKSIVFAKFEFSGASV